MSKSYSDRVMRFRRGVYLGRRHVSPGCLLLLLRLADSMDKDAIVSVPRNTLALELDAPTSRISEWIREAMDKKFLRRVKRGKPGQTAVYQGQFMLPEGYAPAYQTGTPEVPST